MHLPPKDFALALLIIVLWGVNFAVIKVGVADVPPLLLGAMRFALAAFPAVFFLRPPKVPVRLYLLYGLTISVGQFSLLFTAIHIGMPSGLASLVLQSQSLFTMIFAALFLGEHWKPNQLAGLVMAVSGLAAIGTAHGQSMPLLGFLLTVGAAVSWAAGNIVARSIARHGPVNQAAFVVWASLVPPIPFLLLSWSIEGPTAIIASLHHFSLVSLAAVAYLAWLATLLGYGLWTYLLSRHPANNVAPFTLLVPVVGLATGWLAFGERLAPVHYMGGILLVAGVFLNLFGERLFARRHSTAA